MPYPLLHEPDYLQDAGEFSENQDFEPNVTQYDSYEDLPDGHQDFVVAKEADMPYGVSADSGFDFYENMAEYLDDSTLDSLANKLLEDIKADLVSRSELERTWELGIKYLGWKVEEFSSKPFNRCSAVYDDTLSTATLNSLALIMNELFPASGPAKSEVEGYPSKETYDMGERVKIFINFFLTKIDQPYYQDSYRMILYTVLFGTAFRKVVMDPILKQPRSRCIKPQNLIINNDIGTSLLESNRITESMILTKKEILLRQRDGIFRRDTIPDNDDEDDDMTSQVNKAVKKLEGIKKSQTEKSSTFEFYECHAELDPSEVKDNLYDNEDDTYNIPRPYIVDICKTTKKIASIKRNWNSGDNNFKRKECFVSYIYMPGLGLYGVGLSQMLGSNCIALTDIKRQLIDAGTLKNFPGGLRAKGCKLEQNNKVIGPSDFVEIDTGGLPIDQIVMLMPYGEPSTVLAQFMQDLKNDTMAAGSASQQISQMSAANTSEGTILAQLEVQNRVPSVVVRSLHDSLGYELRLIKALFAEFFGDEPYPFNVPGNTYTIMKRDFGDTINVVPVSDPNIVSSRERIVKNELILKLAKENPGILDVREATKRFIESLKPEAIEKLMPEPEQVEPLDPITENVNIMMGKTAKAGLDQDHQAHKITHAPLIQQLAQDPQNNAQKIAALQAHIAEHDAMAYLIQMQQAMGIQMPQPEMLKDPQVQNKIAMMAAQASQQLQQQQQAQNPPPLDPNMVMLKDIEQRREESLLKHEEAQLRAELDAYKAQTQFESNKLKMDVEREMAKEKNEVELAIASMKQPNKPE